MTYLRFLAFVSAWTALDFLSKHMSAQGLASPYYPQAAMALSLLLVGGWPYLIWIPITRIFTSMINWPGPILERLPPIFTFTLAIAGMAYFIRDRLAQSKKSVFQLFSEIAIGVALISLAQSVARVGYYGWIDAGATQSSFIAGLLINWIGDITSLCTLTPALLFIFRLCSSRSHRPWFSNAMIHPRFPSRDELWLSLFRLLPWASSIVILTAFLFFTPVEWHTRAWYLVMFPCIAMALIYGMTGAIFAITTIEICLGFVALVHLSGQNVLDTQIFFLTMALLIYSLGALASERETNVRRLFVGARLMSAAQLIKLRTLTELGERVKGPLNAFCNTLDQNTPAHLALPARQFLDRFETFLDDVQNFDPLANTLTPIHGSRLVDSIATNFPQLDLRITGDSEALGDEKLILEVGNLMAAVLTEQKLKPGRENVLQANITSDRVEFSAHVRLSSGELQPENLNFVTSSIASEWTLPPAGFPLTLYRIHSMAQMAGGKFLLRPSFYSWSDQWLMRVRIPLAGASA